MTSTTVPLRITGPDASRDPAVLADDYLVDRIRAGRQTAADTTDPLARVLIAEHARVRSLPMPQDAA